jgi:ABC-type Mn2+/Zn2+ transport system ATPase subunit
METVGMIFVIATEAIFCAFCAFSRLFLTFAILAIFCGYSPVHSFRGDGRT